MPKFQKFGGQSVTPSNSKMRDILEDYDVDIVEDKGKLQVVYTVSLIGEGDCLYDATCGMCEALMELHEVFEKIVTQVKIAEGEGLN